MSRIEATILAVDPELAAVLQRYWEQDDSGSFPYKTTTLAAELEIHPPALTQYVREQTRAVVPEWACSKCNSPVVVSSRSDYQQQRATWRWAHLSGGFVCAGCRAQAQEEKTAREAAKEDALRAMLRARYSQRDLISDDPAFYSLRGVVYLLAFVRLLASESFEWFSPLNDAQQRLAPTDDYGLSIVKHLHGHELIAVHPGSALEAFVWENETPDRFYLRKVHWTVGIDAGETQAFVRSIETRLNASEWPLSWLEELPGFVEELLVQECLQYLQQGLAEHHLPFTPGDKTKLVFASVLKHYSLGEVYNMIWRQTKDAAAFYQRGGVTQQHAANTVPSGIQRFAERARAEGWSLKRFSRNPRIPISGVSHVLFDTALHLGERLYTITLDSVAGLAQPHLKVATDFVHEIKALLAEPRFIGRTLIHELLTRLQIHSSTLEELRRMTEEVTMGEMEWEDYVLVADTLVDSLTIPRYM